MVDFITFEPKLITGGVICKRTIDFIAFSIGFHFIFANSKVLKHPTKIYTKSRLGF